MLDWAHNLLGGDYAAYTPYAYQLYSFVRTLQSWTLQLVDQVSHKPDLATIALLLIIVLVSLKILNMLFQTVLFWFRLARTLAFWGGFVALALWLYSRGPEGMVEDVQYWYDVWMGQYGHWKEQEKLAQMAQQAMQQKKRWF